MSAASMSGEAISAAAYALPPIGKLGGVGHLVQGFAVAYAIISLIVLCVRVWVRAGFFEKAPTRVWGVEDFLTVIGTLLFIPSCVFAVYAAQFGVGSHDEDLPSPLYMVRAAEYQVYWELLYFVSSTVIKCAVGFTCARLDTRKAIRWILYLNMVVMVLTTVLAVIYVFVNCRPFAATWNPALGVCQTTISLTLVSYIVSAVQMLTDWACAIIPFFIVAELQMSMRRKIAVVSILGLGIVASICTVIRMPYLKYYDTTTYPTKTMYHFGVISLLSTTEAALGTIGCSLPSMRKLFAHYYDSTNRSNYANQHSGGFRSTGSRGIIKLSNLDGSGHRASASATADGSRNGQHRASSEGKDPFAVDDSSQKGILVETKIAVSSHTHESKA